MIFILVLGKMKKIQPYYLGRLYFSIDSNQSVNDKNQHFHNVKEAPSFCLDLHL